MPVVDGNMGSVGSLAGAALQTAGQYLQAQMLILLEGLLGTSIAMFFFLAAAVGGLTMYALTGKYKFALALLIGPPLYFMILPFKARVENADWEFGTRYYPVQRVQEGVRDLYPTVGNNPAEMEVSFLYSLYDRLVSSFVQSTIGVLQLVNDDMDLTFVSAAERYRIVMNLSTEDPKIKAFMQLAVINKCALYYQMLAEYNDAATNDQRRAQLLQELQVRGNSVVYSSTDFPELTEYMRTLSIGTDINTYAVTDGNNQYGLTCNGLWRIAVQAYRRHAAELINRVAVANLSSDQTPSDAMRELQAKFGYRTVFPTGYQQTVTEDQQMIVMINEIAGRMMLREFQQINPDILRPDYNRHQTFQGVGGAQIAQETARNLKYLQKMYEFEEKGDYLTATLAMPYVQGMILFFLSWLFPFFALVIILPSYQRALVTWMGLWLWVKLWDVGFAVVMLIDKVLYVLLPHGNPIDSATLESPERAITALFEVDPTYSVHTYYNLLATCIAAVPVVTGYIVGKGGGQVMDRLGHSLTTFSGRTGEAMALYQGDLISQRQASSYAHQSYAETRRGMYNSQADKTAQAAFYGGAITDAASSVLGSTNNRIAQAAAGPLGAATGVFDERYNTQVDRYAAIAEYNFGVGPGRQYAQTAVSMRFWRKGFQQSGYPTEQILAAENAKTLDLSARGVGQTTGAAVGAGTDVLSRLYPFGGLAGYMYTAKLLEQGDRETDQGANRPAVSPTVNAQTPQAQLPQQRR